MMPPSHSPVSAPFVVQNNAVHCEEDYDSTMFPVLLDMQRNHFWYRGRHELMVMTLRDYTHSKGTAPLSAIDMGGGCGGWVEYLQSHGFKFRELAHADSSARALELAGPVVGGEVQRFQIDLMNLGWTNRWDVVFLLDVLEHLDDDARALEQIVKSLRPGGVLLMTTPALKLFWTYNDDFALHKRRYDRAMLTQRAAVAGLVVERISYFMFFLSPLLLVSRWLSRPPAQATHDENQRHVMKMHAVPAKPINKFLETILQLENRLGRLFRWPWGTSVLAVLRKPE
jgi:SAM-dependent methyltransferase